MALQTNIRITKVGDLLKPPLLKSNNNLI